MLNQREKIQFEAGKGKRKGQGRIGSQAFLFYVLVILSAVALVPEAEAGEYRLFLLRDGGLYTLDSVTGAVQEKSTLEGNPNLIHPTPGGKYVFVLNSRSGRGYAVDFEDPAVMKEVDISRAAPLSAIQFSPMGDVLYVLGQNSDKVLTYKHKAGTVQYSGDFSINGARFSTDYGRIALNTRGTRLYSSTGDSLKFITVADMAVVENLPGLGGDYGWKMAPGGRLLWGAGPEGWQVVDVSRKKLKAEFPGTKVVFPDFDAKGKYAWALGDGGRELAIFHVRRTRELAKIPLPEAAAGLAVDGLKGVWLAAPGGLYAVKEFDKDNTEVTRIGDLPGEGDFRGFVSVQLKSGIGFACF